MSQTSVKKHLHEIDLIRAITVFSVVTLHSLSYTKHLIKNEESLQLFYIIGHSLNYNREIFMFVTALVLTYVYLPRTFSLSSFYFKRLLVVFVPYILWSAIYLLITFVNKPDLDIVYKTFHALITGTASFQLYYILLTLQFYAFFPVFLAFIRKTYRYALPILGIALIMQLTWMYYDFHTIQTTVYDNELLKSIIKYRDRIFILYGFFFLLGGYSAVFFERIQRIIVNYRLMFPLILLVSWVLYTLHFMHQVHIQNISYFKAAGALQPSVILYSIGIIAFVGYAATRWAVKQPLYPMIHTISQASFGVFFLHVMVLTVIQKNVLPLISAVLPIPIIMVLVIFLTFTISVIITTVLLKIPKLSWMVGKPRK